MKKIIIFAHSNIGDLCYDLAVVEPLRRHFPEAEISLFTSARASNIAEGYGGLDRVLVFDRHAPSRGIKGLFRVMPALARMRFDLAVVLKDTIMPYFLGIPRVWKAKIFPVSGQSACVMRHPIDRNLDFLKSHGVKADKAVFNFSIGEDERSFCDRFMEDHRIRPGARLVGIFPIAAWSVKNWPVERWNELAGMLRRELGAAVISFGKSNGDTFNRMVTENISRDIIWADTPTLKHAMALIGRCQIFIGPDSSLLHLASVMGMNVIALYGPTAKDYIYPYAHRDRVITPSVKLDCMPCYPSHNFCPCGAKLRTTTCMEGIAVSEVLSAVRENLGAQRN